MAEACLLVGAGAEGDLRGRLRRQLHDAGHLRLLGREHLGEQPKLDPALCRWKTVGDLVNARRQPSVDIVGHCTLLSVREEHTGEPTWEASTRDSVPFPDRGSASSLPSWSLTVDQMPGAESDNGTRQLDPP